MCSWRRSAAGLIAGCAIAAKSLNPGARVIGVEPEAGDDMRRSLAAGHPVTIEVPRTIADCLQVPSPGELTFGICRALLDEVLTVSDQELIDAMRFAFERLKLVVEPGGVAGLAALLAGRAAVEAGARVGVVLSGGNIDADRFARLVREGAPSV